MILNTVAADHQVTSYLPLLRTNGTIVQLGLVNEPHQLPQLPLIFNRVSVAGCLIGGTPNTQEMLEFCAKHNVLPDCEEVVASQIEEVYKKLVSSNADGVRYVINIKKSLEQKDFVP